MGRIGQAVLILGLLVVAFLALSGLFGSTPEGELTFTTESIDAGRVPLGRTVNALFKLQNVGGKPVKIAKPQVKAIEGC